MCHKIVSKCDRCGKRLIPTPEIIDICDVIRRQQESCWVVTCCTVPRTRCAKLRKRYLPPQPSWLCDPCWARGLPLRQPAMVYGNCGDGRGRGGKRLRVVDQDDDDPPKPYALANRRVPGRDAPGFRTHEREAGTSNKRDGGRAKTHHEEARSGGGGGGGKARSRPSDSAAEGRSVRREHETRKRRDDRANAATNSSDSHQPQEKQQKSSRSNRHKDDSQRQQAGGSSRQQPRRFSVGEHTPEYWEAMSQAYRARGAPSRRGSVGDQDQPQGREGRRRQDPPPPLNLETTRYAAERRNAHLDHALVCAAEQVSASQRRPKAAAASSSRIVTARPGPPPPRPPPPPPLRQSGSSSNRPDRPPRTSTSTTAAAERPISIVSPRPIRPLRDPAQIEEAAKRDEERVDEEVRRGLEKEKEEVSRIPQRRRRISSPPLSQSGPEANHAPPNVTKKPSPPRCKYYLSDDECLVRCTPDRCFHARERGRSSWRIPSFGPSKKRSVSESGSFVCTGAAAAERASRQ